MKSNVRVLVQDPESEVLVPETGYNTVLKSAKSGPSGAASVTGVVLIAFAGLALMAIILRKLYNRLFNYKKVDFKNSGLRLTEKKKSVSFIGLMSVLVFGLGLMLVSLPKSENAVMAAGSVPITAEDTIITITRDSDKTFALASTRIAIDAATPAGYELYVTAPEGSELLPVPGKEADVDVEGDEEGDKGGDVDGVQAAEASIKSIELEAGKTYGALGVNTWGITLDEDAEPDDEKWLPIPESAEGILVDETSVPSRRGDVITVYYGAYVDTDLPEGIYSADVEYRVVVKNTTYSLSYVGNATGVSNIPGRQVAQSKELGYSFTIIQTRPSRNDYTFMGWATSATATSAEYQPGGTIGVTFDVPSITLYAIWKKNNNFTLSYEANGGANAPESQTCVSVELTCNFTVSQTRPSREGYYSFIGWADSPSATVAKYQSGDTLVITSASKTLYAVWEVLPTTNYQLSYNANGGSNAPATQTGIELTTASSHTFTITQATPSYTGYTFAGWASSASATSAEYQPGASITLNATSPNKTLYAVWLKSYSLSYNANGGSNAPATQTASSASESYTFTISSEIPTHECYHFLGWATSPSATKAQYPRNSRFVATSTENVLYAVWDNSGICYHGNGADAGTMSRQSATANQEEMLSMSDYSRAGYGFAGWNTRADGTGATYGPNETITVPASGTLELFAKWIPSAGTMQSFSCSSLSMGQVTALTDVRDGDTYAVAKLVDGKCWFIENLRVGAEGTVGKESGSQGYGGVFIGLANPEVGTFSEIATPNSLYTTDTASSSLRVITGNNVAYRMPRYSLASSYPTSGLSEYSVGNYYTWAAANANTSNITNDLVTMGTSICPKGWRLPAEDFNTLGDAIGGTAEHEYVTARQYPNNFIGGGWVIGNNHPGGYHIVYWTSLAFSDTGARPGTISSTYGIITANHGEGKYTGAPVRCIAE